MNPEEAKQLLDQIIAAQEKLESLALAGDVNAATILFGAAFDFTYSLKKVVLKNPKIILPITRASAGFPAIIVPNQSKDAEHREIFKKCEVGQDSTLNIHSSPGMTFNTPAKRAAVNFYAQMKWMRAGHPPRLPNTFSPTEIEACRKLPAPKRSNFKEWHEVLLMMLPGTDRISEYPEDLRHAVAQSEMKDYEIVDAIKKAVSQALKTILPD